MTKEELVNMLNEALKLEHAARIQYLSHAEQIDGIESETVVARLKELADDEKEHEEKFREMIGAYLGGVPTMGIGQTHDAAPIKGILETNLLDEKHAVDVYMGIMEKIKEMKDELKYEYYQLEHNIRHIIMDEQEHISELKQLLGKK